MRHHLPSPKKILLQSNIPYGYAKKFLNKILTHRIEQYIKEVYTINKWSLFQGWKAGSIFEMSSNDIHYHIKKLKNIMSIDAEKLFAKSTHYNF